MTTAEKVVNAVLNCGVDDIEYMFKTIAENGLLVDAVKECKEAGNEVTANNILYSAFEIAIRKCFGDCSDHIFDYFEIETNCLDSSIMFVRYVDELDDYDSRAEKFAELTGFEIEELH